MSVQVIQFIIINKQWEKANDNGRDLR
jgi:hypothetical protein